MKSPYYHCCSEKIILSLINYLKGKGRNKDRTQVVIQPVLYIKLQDWYGLLAKVCDFAIKHYQPET